MHFYINSSWQALCLRRLLKRLFVSYEVLDYRICILKGVSDGSWRKIGDCNCSNAIKDLWCESSSVTWMTHLLLPTTDPLIPTTWDRLLPCSTCNIYIASCVRVNAALRVHLKYVYGSPKIYHVMCVLEQAFLFLFWEIVFPRTGNKNNQCCNKLGIVQNHFACFFFFLKLLCVMH